MVPIKVRIVGVLVLLSAAFSLYLFTSSNGANDAYDAKAAELRKQSAETMERAGMSPAVIAAEQQRLEQAAQPSGGGATGMIGFVFLGLGVVQAVMGLHLIVRGSAPWIATLLLVSLVLSVLGMLPAIPALLKAPAYAIGMLARLAIGYWCWSVVSEDAAGAGPGRRGRAAGSGPDDDMVSSGPSGPSFLRPASDTPAPMAQATPTLAVAVAAAVAQPVALLHLQAPLDAAGIGGWIESPGALQVQASPVPSGPMELLAADAAGTWHTLAAPEPVTGTCRVHLPAGSWYLVLRGDSAGVPTILYVTSAPQHGAGVAAA